MAESIETIYPPLETVTKPHVTTPEAAYYLSRSRQTLRIWACHETGPIRPQRIYGRLAWPTDKLKALLGIATTTQATPKKRRSGPLLAVVGGM